MKNITPEQFVKLWQTCKTLAEFSRKSGVPKRRATGRAAQYRRHGVPLQHFARHNVHRNDYAELKRLALSLTNKSPCQP